MLQEVAMARDSTAARTLTSQPGDEFPPEVSTRPSPQQAGHPSQQPARPRRRSGVSVIGEPQASDVVSRLHASLRERIGPQRYAVWFDGICRFAIESEAVTVISDGQFAQDLVRRSFRGDIEAVAAEVVGGVQAVLFDSPSRPMSRWLRSSTQRNHRPSPRQSVMPNERSFPCRSSNRHRSHCLRRRSRHGPSRSRLAAGRSRGSRTL